MMYCAMCIYITYDKVSISQKENNQLNEEDVV